jgi:hypothetical protein
MKSLQYLRNEVLNFSHTSNIWFQFRNFNQILKWEFKHQTTEGIKLRTKYNVFVLAICRCWLNSATMSMSLAIVMSTNTWKFIDLKDLQFCEKIIHVQVRPLGKNFLNIGHLDMCKWRHIYYIKSCCQIIPRTNKEELHFLSCIQTMFRSASEN